MKRRGMKSMLAKYMRKCKAYETDPSKFGRYVYGYWLPWLQMEREAGNLVQGRL